MAMTVLPSNEPITNLPIWPFKLVKGKWGYRGNPIQLGFDFIN
ncbi:hypothetical protein SD457_20145 [Coprobacillaceae bacterium CR2/5/TPMF4]|nr:hypothetical protein SD457_20145 [Coprobacillaceae bacterium CR2/5/TPMF4]